MELSTGTDRGPGLGGRRGAGAGTGGHPRARLSARRWAAGGLGLVLWVLAGCGETVPAAVDQTPPGSTFSLSLPGARRLVVSPGTTYVTRAAQVAVVIELDEEGSIEFTLDGSAIEPGNPSVSRGGRRVVFNFTPDRPIIWRGIDAAGNAAAPLRIDFVLDRVPPTIFLDPEGGDFDGPVTVTVSTDEPARLELRLDGRWPSPGRPGTVFAEAPYAFTLREDAQLRAYAYDQAGNRGVPLEVDYQVDTRAPQTVAEPPAGWYPGPISVAVRVDDPLATVHYTLDGSPPTYASPVLEGSLRVEADTVLRHRGIDPGGNAEPVRTAEFTFGPRPAPAPERLDEDVHLTAGGLDLAAALLGLGGPLAGAPLPFGAATDADFGLRWSAFGHGRAALDAALLYAGVEPHGWHAPGVVALAASGQGTPDLDGNGANLDDTWRARAEALARAVDAPPPPPGLQPVSVPYRAGLAVLLRPGTPEGAAEQGPDGRPLAVSQPTRWRWAGARVQDRVIDPATAGAWLSAVAAYAQAGLGGQHTQGGSAFARGPGAVVGLRCAGCHGAEGAPPRLDSALALAAAEGLFNRAQPADSRLVALLSGAEPHLNLAPATAPQVEGVVRWIEAGALAIDTPPRPGADAEAAREAALMLEAAAFAVDHLQRLAAVDTRSGGPGLAAATSHLAAESVVLEGPGPEALGRRVESVQVRDRALVVAGHARWVQGLAALKAARAAAEARTPGLALPGVTLVDPLPAALAALLAVQGEGGGFPMRRVPGAPADADFDAEATASAVLALVAARDAGLTVPTAALEAAGDALVAALDAAGWVRDGDAAAGLDLGGRRRLAVQCRALEAWLALGETPRFRAAAEALFRRLEAQWWPAGTDRPVVAWGAAELRFDAALAAMVLRALGAAGRAGIEPEAAARRAATLVRGVVLGELLLSESWLTGEVGPAAAPGDGAGAAGASAPADEDGDGLKKPEAAPVQDRVGAPPVFTGTVVR